MITLPDRLQRRYAQTWLMGNGERRDAALQLAEDVVLWIADLAEREAGMTAWEYAQRMKREFGLPSEPT